MTTEQLLAEYDNICVVLKQLNKAKSIVEINGTVLDSPDLRHNLWIDITDALTERKEDIADMILRRLLCD